MTTDDEGRMTEDTILESSVSRRSSIVREAKWQLNKLFYRSKA